MPANKSLILADAHVHIYDCFDVACLLDAAHENFRLEASRRSQADAFLGVLCLTETAQDHWFTRLCHAEGHHLKSNKNSTHKGWRFTRCQEPCSLLATDGRGGQLVLIAGRQLVTAERLEVLALGTVELFPDGKPTEETIQIVQRAGGVPVIPWGAGKWLGRRGRLVTRLLESTQPNEIYLGDNSGRPVFWPDPSHFKQARTKNMRILPGSDPLPFPSEFWRPGSVGFALRAAITLDHPARDLKSILRNPDINPEPYGLLERPYRFFRNQLAMQLRKRTRNASLQ
jgi:hypothetical protein